MSKYTWSVKCAIAMHPDGCVLVDGFVSVAEAWAPIGEKLGLDLTIPEALRCLAEWLAESLEEEYLNLPVSAPEQLNLPVTLVPHPSKKALNGQGD